MFCPQCGSENGPEKNYCRQCGLPLSAVRLALDGRVDNAIKIVDGDKNLWRYRFRIGIASLLILIGISTILTGGTIGFSNIQSAAVILIIVMIVFIHFSRKSRRIARLLDTEDDSAPLNLAGREQQAVANGTRDTNIVGPSSITEQSTLKLKPGVRDQSE